ncbi:MAG: transcription elongation factor GreB [Gammaproteobacteria bacterium]|nr:transcription elongation factor GreB [Gammaproteobacteria bacterium]
MSRYRPPREKSSPYITRVGYSALNDELKQLWKVTRPEVTQKVSEAAALGDRSENAEYIYGKKQLREIDSRIRFLSTRLDEITVVDKPPNDVDKVYFGARVTLADENGALLSYRLVGPDEFDREPEYLSIDSPMARALLKKTVDDEITLVQANEERRYTLIEICYETATG